MIDDSIALLFAQARDRAVSDIMDTCCGGEGQRARTDAALREAFQPVLDEVVRRLKLYRAGPRA